MAFLLPSSGVRMCGQLKMIAGAAWNNQIVKHNQAYFSYAQELFQNRPKESSQ